MTTKSHHVILLIAFITAQIIALCPPLSASNDDNSFSSISDLWWWESSSSQSTVKFFNKSTGFQLSPEIEHVYIDGITITEHDWTALQQTKKLERLSIINCSLTSDDINRLSTLTNLKGLRLGKKLTTDGEFAALAKIHSLEELYIKGTYTETRLESLGQLPQLKYLYLSGENVGPEGLKELANLPSLEHLAFYDMTPDGAQSLPFMPKLKELVIGWKGKGAFSLRPLEQQKSLEILSIYGDLMEEDLVYLTALQSLREMTYAPSMLNMEVKLSDTGAGYLSQIKSLEKLSLYSSGLTDKGLESLSLLENLRVLELPNNDGLTDAGVLHLSGLSRLEELNLRGELLTETGLSCLVGMESLVQLRLLIVNPEMVGYLEKHFREDKGSWARKHHTDDSE